MNDGFNNEVRTRLDGLLGTFERIARPGPYEYRWAHHHDGGQHPFHVVFGCMVHGNEFGSLPAALQLVEALTSGTLNYGGRVTVFIGNPEAARENRRYLEADLNRVFLDTGESRHEDRRAQALMPILNDADLLVDFHQTILDTASPFYVFPWQKQGWQWARATKVTDVWVTRDPSVGFSAGTRCTDEYVAARGKPGVTLELSRKGFSDSAEVLCWASMVGTLEAADELARGVSIETQAERLPDFKFLTTGYREPFDDPEKALAPGLVNFQSVAQGQALHAEGSPAMHAPFDGFTLFPKYPARENGRAIAPWPGEIYRLVTPMTKHPLTLWGGD